MWHGVTFHDHVLSVHVFGPTPWAFPIVLPYTFEVVWEPAMSQVDTGYPVAESSREEAFRACVVWCLRCVGVWGVWSSVEILQGVLLDESSYCGFRRSGWLFCVLNEWGDIVEYSINLEV